MQQIAIAQVRDIKTNNQTFLLQLRQCHQKPQEGETGTEEVSASLASFEDSLSV